MDKNGNHTICQIADSLHDVINAERCSWAGSGPDHEIHFNRLVYSREHNLIVVEIDREQSRELPETFFEDESTKQELLERSDCYRVDIVILESHAYVYFWMSEENRLQIAKTGNLAYVF